MSKLIYRPFFMTESNLRHLIARVLGSYREIGGINNIDGSNLPSKRAIAQICEDFLQILFPGFHDEQPIATEQVDQITSERILSVAERLQVEAFKSLRLQEPDCPRRRATEIVTHLIGQLPAVRDLLQTDVEAAYEGDPASTSFDEIIVAYPSVEAVAIQRIAHALYREELPLIPRIMTEWAHSRTGIDIHPGASIGGSFFIDHGTGVVIGETAVIGERVRLYQAVTLGAKRFSVDDSGALVKGEPRHPLVEDDVVIYGGATILGRVTI